MDAAPAALGAGPRPTLETLGLPEDASANGHRIDELLALSHRFDFILTVLLVAVLGGMLWRFRGARKVEANGGTQRSRTLVMVMALTIFGVVDGSMFARSLAYQDEVLWNFAVPEGNPDTVRLEVNARQWAWEVRYAGEDGRFNTADDVLTWSEVRVPVGKPVWVQLASTDVVHGFSLPNFRVKLDAVPGRVNQTWFQAAREGSWEVACYQHCGTSHYKMRGTLTAMAPEAYAAWLREASRQAVRAYDGADSAAHWGWEWRAKP
jgi:cytochrome c oxidase subunit 2